MRYQWWSQNYSVLFICTVELLRRVHLEDCWIILNIILLLLLLFHLKENQLSVKVYCALLVSREWKTWVFESPSCSLVRLILLFSGSPLVHDRKWSLLPDGSPLVSWNLKNVRLQIYQLIGPSQPWWWRGGLYELSLFFSAHFSERRRNIIPIRTSILTPELRWHSVGSADLVWEGGVKQEIDLTPYFTHTLPHSLPGCHGSRFMMCDWTAVNLLKE